MSFHNQKFSHGEWRGGIYFSPSVWGETEVGELSLHQPGLYESVSKWGGAELHVGCIGLVASWDVDQETFTKSQKLSI